ncbi:MAG: hypothetical protein K0B11_21335 [Mariniphaga sp.]|nr:hypothetical protein [Mariniphaga sp.]
MNKKLQLAVFLFIIFFVFQKTIDAKVWIISDSNLEVRFNDETALLSVTDKRCNKTWEQVELIKKWTSAKTTQTKNLLTISLSGEFPLEVILKLTESSALEVELIADAKAPFEKLSFPPAFQTPDENHYLLFTDGEGFLLKADDTEYGIGRQIMHSMRGLSMPWMGITDSKFETGYMAILDTPDDSEIWVKRYDGLISFEPLWISQKGKFGYDRKITYHFFSEGGYVAQCKKYREYIWSKNEVPFTLTENKRARLSVRSL